MSTFPNIATGILTQLPWAIMLKANVGRVEMESGFVYAYYHDASPLASWDLNFSVLTSDELATLRTFWEGRKGAWDTFAFTDPDSGTLYSACRFVGDEFAVSYLDVGQYALKLTITEVR